MRKSIFVLITTLLLIPFIFNSCKENEKVEPDDKNSNQQGNTSQEELYFSLELDEGYFSFSYDYWVVLTNFDGEILDVENISGKSKIDFFAMSDAITDEIGVHFLQIYLNNPDYKFFTINSYLNIPKAETFHLKGGRGSVQSIGEIEVNILNSPRPESSRLMIIDNFNSKSSSGSSSSSSIDKNFADGKLDSINTKFKIAIENDTVVISNTFDDDDPRYTKLFNVNAGESYTVDFDTDFIPFEHNIGIEIPIQYGSYFIQTGGVNEKNGAYCTFATKIASESLTKFQFPFLDEFNIYFTYGFISQPVGRAYSNLYFDFYGNLPDPSDLVFPEWTFEISDENYHTFNYSTNGDYDYMRSVWGGSHRNTNLNLFKKSGEEGQQPLLSIPDEITNLYEYIDLEQMEYQYSSLYLSKDLNYKESMESLDRRHDITTPKRVIYAVF